MRALIRVFGCSVLMSCGSPVPAASPEPLQGSRTLHPAALTLYVGQAHVLNEPDIRRIAIGNGKVIQATALDERQILIVPEAPGQSTLHLWGHKGPERHLVVTVLPADVGRQVAEVRALLGEPANLRVRALGEKLLVEGESQGEEQAGRLAEVVRRYPQVVSLVNKVGAERMIAMDVRMVEIRRESLENIGVRWNGSAPGPTFGVVGDLKRSQAFTPGGSADTGAALEIRPRVGPFASVLGIASSIGSVINLLVQRGDAMILAEPSLSCRSGGSARFLAGGELPIPYASGLGNTSVVFKEYGVKFDVSPTAGRGGMIAAKIATEISAINFDVQVKEIPGISKRRAETEVNLRENETLVIAGLMSEESTRSVDQVPALGDLPVLGRLFKSRAFRDRQTELVVFITPRFVGGVADTAPRDDAADVEAARQQAATVRDRGEWLRESGRFLE